MPFIRRWRTILPSSCNSIAANGDRKLEPFPSSELMKVVPSVTTQIRGGIGNQLFIYAMVRRLSFVNDVPLYLDTKAGFDGDPFRRTCGLNVFNISGHEIVKDRLSQLNRRVVVGLNQILPFSRRWYFCESKSGFDGRYLDMHVIRPIFLEGYWQDERYFSDIRSELKGDLTFLHPHTEASKNLAREMRASESVAVHVRQLQVERLPSEYYRAAIQKIKERTREPRFYLFSDSTASIDPRIGGECKES